MVLLELWDFICPTIPHISYACTTNNNNNNSIPCLISSSTTTTTTTTREDSSLFHLMTLLFQKLRTPCLKSFSYARYDQSRKYKSHPAFILERPNVISKFVNLYDVKISHQCQLLFVCDAGGAKVYIFHIKTKNLINSLSWFKSENDYPHRLCVEEDASTMTGTCHLFISTSRGKLLKCRVSKEGKFDKKNCVIWEKHDFFEGFAKRAEMTILYSKRDGNRILCCVEKKIIMLNSQDGSVITTFETLNLITDVNKHFVYVRDASTIQIIDPCSMAKPQLVVGIRNSYICIYIYILEMQFNEEQQEWKLVEKKRFTKPGCSEVNVILDRGHGLMMLCRRGVDTQVISLHTGQEVQTLNFSAKNGCLDEVNGVGYFIVGKKVFVFE
ncbi:hypothetical protein FDP41_005970 [Naegleria fowleri]|uniref:Uncharacterized protein n=1 Tax=Naegleria fowleri TaxID=5763 RepID=A0A6A5BDS3_NAEFO|nr:uncharacterized protein FDP41_005970 [Naegleria fowleri]KAF0975217.1 hypothetical protein FDP41_005970 [Naegleria fowleri]